MRNIFTLAAREVRSSFVTPLAFVVMSGFMLLSGFFFFTLLQQFTTLLARAAMVPGMNTSLNEWVIVPFYQTLEVVLIFLIPVLTMRALAEERKSGTFEFLATSPLSSAEIILGKFFGLGVVVSIMLLLSFSFPLVLVLFSDPEVMPIIVGFLGLLLFALSFLAIGIAISAFCKNQTVAGVASLVVLLVFYVIDAPAEKLGGVFAEVLQYLAPATHTQTIVQGVLTGADLLYFISVMLVGLFIANRVLDAQQWR